MRRALFLAALLVGCTNEHALELDIVSSVDVPPEVVSWELRITQVDPGEPCPTAEEAASAARVGRLVHAQSFEDVGMSVGEIPRGQWAFAVLARDATCAPQLYGCTSIAIGNETFSPIPIRVEPVVDVTATCGTCRTCSAGACSAAAAICD